MKKSKWITLLALIAALGASMLAIAACQKEPSAFLPEYEIRSGEAVTLPGGGVTYRLARETAGLSVDAKTGTFTFTDVEPYTQVILLACKKDTVVAETKVTLVADFSAGSVRFVNLTDHIVSGERVRAVSETGGAVVYALKDPVAGISVGRTDGKVAFTENLADGTSFTVVASSRGATAEKTFAASTKNFVTVECDRQIVSLAQPNNIGFKLDFTGSGAEEQGVLGVQSGGAMLPAEKYSYDHGSRMLKIDRSAFSDFTAGEKQLFIITAKNSVAVTVLVATSFISTAEQLAAINDSPEALSGYYVLTRDIDLTAYCAATEEGWTPIGTYHDVADGTALSDAFKGTVDGNGHTVTGFMMKRSEASDIRAYNAGLFGYIDTAGTVKNLGLVGGDIVVRSFSGAFAGVNTGTIENCFSRVNVECIGNYVGGFVGRNEGTIRNCYAYGKVVGEENKGTFAGRNMGVIENGFGVRLGSVAALVGVEEGKTSGRSFSSAEEFKAYPFEELPAPWVTGSEFPALGQSVRAYYLLGVFMTGLPQSLYKGQSTPLNAVVSPSDALDAAEVTFISTVGSIQNGVLVIPKKTDEKTCVVTASCGGYTDTFTIELLDPKIVFMNDEPGIVKGTDYAVRVEIYPALPEYLAAVTYRVDNGLTVTGAGVISTTRNTTASECTVTVSVEGVASAEKKLRIYDRVTGVAFTDDTDDVVYAGNGYRLFAAVTPATALQTVTYRVTGVAGVTVAGDALYVSDTAASGTAELTVTAGSYSAVKQIRVVGKTPFPDNDLTLAEGEDAVFTLPVPTDGAVVRRMEKRIEAAISGNIVTVPWQYLDGFGTRKIEVTFTIGDTVYVGYVTVVRS